MPKPIQYLKDDEIEEMAAEMLDKHVEGGRHKTALPVDIDTLTECNFRFKVVWRPIADPPGCRTFATLLPILNSDLFVAELTLNENFREFLTEHPEIERLTRGHELCHWHVHVDEGKLRSGLLPFGDTAPLIRYHRSQYSDGLLSDDQKNRLAKFALQDDRAYRALRPREHDIDASIEPSWMHRQAEHFAACLLVPRHPLFRALESGDDPAFYGTHVRLAQMFQVSKRVIQIRLQKLGIIEEIGNGKFRNALVRNRPSF
ncbi:MAG: ImmA/IrrE family metallo-endopeptidase [Acidobacteria bacterium]|nr:ImmA/IrrE family metallo-endopeptidase [Acidobacteriota bacterium]